MERKVHSIRKIRQERGEELTPTVHICFVYASVAFLVQIICKERVSETENILPSPVQCACCVVRHPQSTFCPNSVSKSSQHVRTSSVFSLGCLKCRVGGILLVDVSPRGCLALYIGAVYLENMWTSVLLVEACMLGSRECGHTAVVRHIAIPVWHKHRLSFSRIQTVHLRVRPPRAAVFTILRHLLFLRKVSVQN